MFGLKKIKKINAFTLAETLVVVSIIGVLSVLMVSTMGNKTDRNKALFKKVYSLTERTVVELVNDESYYPYDASHFGFAEISNTEIIGAKICIDDATPPCLNCVDGKKRDDCYKEKVDNQKLAKFCKLFSNNLNTSKIIDKNGCEFTTNDNVYWKILTSKKRDENNFSGFLIMLDVDGNDKGLNKPNSVNNTSDDSQGKIKNRDRFYVYVRDDGKIFLPANDNVAQNYLGSTNFNSEEN